MITRLPVGYRGSIGDGPLVSTGAVVMATFWLGTLPVMMSLGLVAQRGFGPLRARLPALTAAALVVLGLLTITGKFHATAAGVRNTGSVHVCH